MALEHHVHPARGEDQLVERSVGRVAVVGDLRVGGGGHGPVERGGLARHLGGPRGRVVTVGQPSGRRRQRAPGAAERGAGGAGGGHVRGGRAGMEGVEGGDFSVGFVVQFVSPPAHVAAVATEAAHAVGEAPEARGALAGLGGAGNADRLDIGGVGGGERGAGFVVSGAGVFEAVVVVDQVVVTAVALMGRLNHPAGSVRPAADTSLAALDDVARTRVASAAAAAEATTPGPPTLRSGTGSRSGASGAASPTRSTPARRWWPPTSPSGPRA